MLVLASASPRRAELIARLGIGFGILAADCDEALPDGIPVAEAACILARRKAERVMQLLAEGARPANWFSGRPLAACSTGQGLPAGIGGLLAADTLVVLEGQVFGKPATQQQAMQMLRALSGRPHTVLTGVCLIGRGVDCFAEQTEVYFDDIPPHALAALAADGMDKAGAYGIQSAAGPYIRRIVGSYDNVVGLPLCAVRAAMQCQGLL